MELLLISTQLVIVIASGHLLQKNSDNIDLETALRLGTTIAGVNDILVLCTASTANGKGALGSMSWRELL